LAYGTGLVNQQLLLENEYLAAENRILKARLQPGWRLSDGERATLAEIGKRLGRKGLQPVARLAKPDTILAWYRRLVAEKFDGSKRRRTPGRPRTSPEIVVCDFLRAGCDRFKRSACPIGSCSGNVRYGKRLSSSQSIITQNATIKARTTCCSSLPLLGLSPVGDMASAVENALAAYSGTTAAPHEYLDHTGGAVPALVRSNEKAGLVASLPG